MEYNSCATSLIYNIYIMYYIVLYDTYIVNAATHPKGLVGTVAQVSD